MRASRMLTTALVFAAASPVALWAQEHGGEGGSGGGLFDINVGLSLWTLFVFAGLVLLCQIRSGNLRRS